MLTAGAVKARTSSIPMNMGIGKGHALFGKPYFSTLSSVNLSARKVQSQPLFEKNFPKNTISENFFHIDQNKRFQF